jgi:hypothetical protein
MQLFFASFAVPGELCDTAVLPELKQYRKERNEPQGTQRVFENKKQKHTLNTKYHAKNHPTYFIYLCIDAVPVCTNQ